MADIKVRNLKRFDETAGCLWCPAGLSIRASGAATGAELRSIWTGRAHDVHARVDSLETRGYVAERALL